MFQFFLKLQKLNKMKKLIIAGGTGFLGKEISKYYLNKGYTVKILTRTPKEDIDIYWDGKSIEQVYTKQVGHLLIHLVPMKS